MHVSVIFVTSVMCKKLKLYFTTICLWYILKGAFGGSLILSRKHRHMMNGIHRYDRLHCCFIALQAVA